MLCCSCMLDYWSALWYIIIDWLIIWQLVIVWWYSMNDKVLDTVIDDKVKQICYGKYRIKQICLVKQICYICIDQICYIYIDHTRNYYNCSISVADIVSGWKWESFSNCLKMLQKQQYSPNNNHYSVDQRRLTGGVLSEQNASIGCFFACSTNKAQPCNNKPPTCNRRNQQIQ